MKAAVSTGIRSIQIKEMETPVPGKNEALIRVDYCGICGSDLHGFLCGDPFAPFPHVFGHEGSGTIAAINGESEDFVVGDRVVFETTKRCGKCKACRENRIGDCSDIKLIGGHLPGSFAEYVAIPLELLYHVPENISQKTAALCEPYTISARGCAKAEVGAGDRVLILGAGTIALCAVDVVKAREAKAFIAARNPFRLDRARRFGPDGIIDTASEDLRQRIDELTGGDGCSVILECTGAKNIIEETYELAVRATRIVMIGMCPEDVSVSHFNVINKELKVFGTQNSYGQFPWVLEKMEQGLFHEEELLSDVYEYTEAQEAFEFAVSNAGKCGKVMLRFNPDA